MTFQKLLNDYLTQLGCTARELSAVSGISAPVISRYRSGSHSPDLAEAVRRDCSPCGGTWVEGNHAGIGGKRVPGGVDFPGRL